jgi:hypothetical protein
MEREGRLPTRSSPASAAARTRWACFHPFLDDEDVEDLRRRSGGAWPRQSAARLDQRRPARRAARQPHLSFAGRRRPDPRRRIRSRPASIIPASARSIPGCMTSAARNISARPTTKRSKRSALRPLEGIIPALEPSHALARAKLAHGKPQGSHHRHEPLRPRRQGRLHRRSRATSTRRCPHERAFSQILLAPVLVARGVIARLCAVRLSPPGSIRPKRLRRRSSTRSVSPASPCILPTAAFSPCSISRLARMKKKLSVDTSGTCTFNAEKQASSCTGTETDGAKKFPLNENNLFERDGSYLKLTTTLVDRETKEKVSLRHLSDALSRQGRARNSDQGDPSANERSDPYRRPLQGAGRRRPRGLVTFITGGDPDYETSLAILKSGCQSRRGYYRSSACPSPTPWPTARRSRLASLRALAGGSIAEKTLRWFARFRAGDNTTPIVLMGYYNPV